MSAPNTSEPTGALPFTGAVFTLPVMALGLALSLGGLVLAAFRRVRASQS